MTEPVYRRKQGKSGDTGTAAREKSQQLYRGLIDAVRDLEEYAESLKNHSNSEIRRLTEEIRRLMRED